MVFHANNHLGGEAKSIAVATVSGTQEKIDLLKLQVDIRPAVTLDPGILSWGKDEPLTPKRARVKASQPGQSVTITQIKGGEPDFKVAMDAAGPGTAGSGSWISVTPVSTARPRRTLIRITVQKADQTPRQIITYAIVRPN